MQDEWGRKKDKNKPLNGSIYAIREHQETAREIDLQASKLRVSLRDFDARSSPFPFVRARALVHTMSVVTPGLLPLGVRR